MCEDFYDDPYEYPQYMDRDTVIDCTCVTSTSYNQAGEPIVGDLKQYGWAAMRGLTIDPSTATEINTMAIKGAGK